MQVMEADQMDGEAVAEDASKAAHSKKLRPAQHYRGEPVP